MVRQSHFIWQSIHGLFKFDYQLIQKNATHAKSYSYTSKPPARCGVVGPIATGVVRALLRVVGPVAIGVDIMLFLYTPVFTIFVD